MFKSQIELTLNKVTHVTPQPIKGTEKLSIWLMNNILYDVISFMQMESH